MVARPHFYRLADRLSALLSSLGLAGKVLVSVPDRLPGNDKWTAELTEAIREGASRSASTMSLSDETTIDLSLHKAATFTVPSIEIMREARRLFSPTCNLAVIGVPVPEGGSAPIIFRVDSRRQDEVLASYLADLRDANRQISGKRPALIVCFVPEVPSFDGLQAGSALHNMTLAFFEEHAKTCVYGVSYVSDPTVVQEGISLTRTSPALAFHNHKYDTNLGEGFPLLA
jgi:hypothetical protein